MGTTMALSSPVKKFMMRVKVATLLWTSGILHWGFSPPMKTGRAGGSESLWLKCSLQMNDRILIYVNVSTFASEYGPFAEAEHTS
jgi:hypothetical protein